MLNHEASAGGFTPQPLSWVRRSLRKELAVELTGNEYLQFVGTFNVSYWLTVPWLPVDERTVEAKRQVIVSDVDECVYEGGAELFQVSRRRSHGTPNPKKCQENKNEK